MPALVCKPLTPSRWKAFETLFGPNGACAGCWCQWIRQPQAQYRKNQGAPNKRLTKAFVDSGRTLGLLAYRGKEAVGWVALAPRAAYKRLDSSRILKPLDDQPVWSVPCFYVAQSARGQGVTVALLKAAAAYAKRKGAAILEGYPVDTKGAKTVNAFLWWGTWSAFKKAGFKEAARRSPKRPVARLALR